MVVCEGRTEGLGPSGRACLLDWGAGWRWMGVSRCGTCRGVMVSEPDEPYPSCMLCHRTGHEAEATERAAACSRPGCLRPAIYGRNLCQYHQAAVSRADAGRGGIGIHEGRFE